jgi:hypothetical protein
MVVCIIALFVFSFLSIFSARYRRLAKEAMGCVFLKMTLRPCQSGLDDRIKAELVSGVLGWSPATARLVNTHFEAISWVFVILMLGSAFVTAQGIYNFYQYGSCDPENPELCLITNAIGGDPICPNTYDGINVGPDDAEVLIIEFGCFTCPYTEASEKSVRDILEEYDGRVRYVFKTFPIERHNNSIEAAAASICANEQGKYWEYRELLFTNQERISEGNEELLVSLAEDTGMDTAEFFDCLSADSTIEQIEVMQEEGLDSRIVGTPTFFVNHRYVEDPDDLERMVEEELAKR